MNITSRATMTAAFTGLVLMGISLAPAYADDLSPSSGTAPVESEAPAPEAPSASVDEPEAEPDTAPAAPLSSADSPEVAPDGSAPSDERAAVTAATQILTPADGAVVPKGSVAYTVQVATEGSYWMELYCGDDDEFRDGDYLTASSAGEEFSGSLGTVYEGESCNLELYAADSTATGWDSTSFAVTMNLEIRNATAGPEEFYPTVRDGFRDNTSIGFGSRLDSEVTVKIVSRATSAVVRTFTLAGRDSRDYYARRSVTWNGRNRSGNLVSTGRYAAVITSSLNGHSASARVPLKVASGHRTVRTTQTKDGWYDSRDRTRGNCYTWQVSDGNDLDCWGGRYAQATYRFSLPRSARNLSWRVRGYNECCDLGRVIKSGQRTSATSFRITVRVTNWRSFVVRSARVTYTYRKAI